MKPAPAELGRGTQSCLWSVCLAIRCSQCGLCPDLRHALFVAIPALHPVDIVLACLAGVRGVHLLHVNSAVRHGRMTSDARGSRALAMTAVTGEAAKTFMHASGRAVVAGTCLRSPVISCRNVIGIRGARSVALVADRKSTRLN